ncbi:MAG: MFS transporter [Promethearchaeota archaeon]
MEQPATQETFRSYMVFFTGQMFSLLGSLVVFFVIFVWITITTQDPVMISIANFINLLPILAFFPIAGVISDRYNRKKIILVADSLIALFTAILAILFLFEFTNVWFVITIIGFRSICQAFHMPAVSAIIPSMIPREKLSRSNGIRFMFVGVVQMLGPAVGATLLFFFPIKYILWIDVITYFIALVPLIALKVPVIQFDKEKIEKSSFLIEMKDGFSIIKKIPGLIIIMVLAMALNLLAQPTMTLSTFYIRIIHGGSNFVLAVIQMAMQGGMILGSLVVSVKKKWKNRMRTLFIGILIINVGNLSFALAPLGFFLMMGIGSLIIGFVSPIINIIVLTVIQISVPLDKMGRVSSLLNTLIMIASPIGAFLSGPLSIFLGVSTLLFLAAMAEIILTLLTYTFTGIRHIDYDKVIVDSMS